MRRFIPKIFDFLFKKAKVLINYLHFYETILLNIIIRKKSFLCFVAEKNLKKFNSEKKNHLR